MMTSQSATHLSLVTPSVKPLPTVLQVCSTLGYGGSERVALQSAIALQQAGGRSLISGTPGGLVDDIVANHIKFIPMSAEGYNPLGVIANVRLFRKLYEREKLMSCTFIIVRLGGVRLLQQSKWAFQQLQRITVHTICVRLLSVILIVLWPAQTKS